MWRIKKAETDKEERTESSTNNQTRILIDVSSLEGYENKAILEGNAATIVGVFAELLQNLSHFPRVMEEAMRIYKEKNP